MGEYLLGRAAQNAFNKRLKMDQSAELELGVFSKLLLDDKIFSTTFFSSPSHQLKKTIVLQRSDVSKAIAFLKAFWEKIFDDTTKNNHWLSWVVLCRPIYSNQLGKKFIQANMLQEAGLDATTACKRGVLLAKVSCTFLVAIALMDGAAIQLSQTHQKDIVVRLTGSRMVCVDLSFQKEIILLQQGSTCYASIARNLCKSLCGT
jgi:hypothetical protein